MDFYRKVPEDLKQATRAGGACSVLWLVLLGWIVLAETGRFLTSEYRSRIDVDASQDQLRIDFNISFPQLHCDRATVDLWDKIGRNQADITRTVEKWQLDETGRQRAYKGRDRVKPELAVDTHHSLDELHENGVHVDHIDGGREAWDAHLSTHEYAFVQFWAPWCPFCLQLAPTWEALAEDTERKQEPVSVAYVDCTREPQLCRDEDVHAFPTLRLYRKGLPVHEGTYRGDRTVVAMAEFLAKKLELQSIYAHYPQKQETRREHWDDDDPGCRIAGHVLVNRVPGNFHITAHQSQETQNAKRTDVSHVIHTLSFGAPLRKYQRRTLGALADAHARTAPAPDAHFRGAYHKGVHHFLNVVPTCYEISKYRNGRFSAFQTLHNAHAVMYPLETAPEARFAYDISHMAVVVERRPHRWYTLVTSLLALIGGSFAFFRLASQAGMYAPTRRGA